MRFSILRFFVLLLCIASSIGLAEHPKATIHNAMVTASLYTPDRETGYYRGTRFDWSGVIYSLTHDGHEYFGEWQKSEDPYLHDRITGPVDSFEVDTEIKEDETFLRIGVGICAKRKDQSTTKHPFEVINHGKWTTTKGENWIEFKHELEHEPTKQGYRYLKRLTLIPGKPELVIDHTLTNIGQAHITSEVYNHNFFVLDSQPTGPDFVVKFPFQLTVDRELKGIGQVRGNELTYARKIEQGNNIFAIITGYGTNESDNQFVIENRKTGAAVSAKIDRPIDKLRYWSPRTTLCPEPFINLDLKRNQSDRWSIHYRFYSLGK